MGRSASKCFEAKETVATGARCDTETETFVPAGSAGGVCTHPTGRLRGAAFGLSCRRTEAKRRAEAANVSKARV